MASRHCLSALRKLGPVALVMLSLDVAVAQDVAQGGVGAKQAPANEQLWLVSTRSTSYCNPSPDQTSRLRYWRYAPGHSWQRSSLGELTGSDDPDVTTLVYVHENRVTRNESFQRSKSLYSELSRVVPPDQPFRLISISWPSDRIGCLPRPDVQAKAQRSEAHGYYLAWLLDQMDPDVPVALFGYSYGPRMITTALHYLGGGSIHGRRMRERVHPNRKPVRAVLMAAALDADWLSPGQHHGKALTQLEHVVVTINPCDSALRWYPRMYGRGGPPALGYVGIPRHSGLRIDGDKIVEWNVSRSVGSTHSWTVYEGSPSMMAKIVPHLFGS